MSCNNSSKDQSINLTYQIDSAKKSHNQDTLFQRNIDSIKYNSKSTTSKTNNNPNKKKEKNSPATRFIDFPSDANFNGKPMTQQEEITKEILEKHPDTLSKLAIMRYKSYEHFFPKSIADNFENGISTEHIYYPEKLIFRFELFENEFSWTPYVIKEVIVRRNTNGELYTE